MIGLVEILYKITSKPDSDKKDKKKSFNVVNNYLQFCLPELSEPLPASQFIPILPLDN